MELNKTAHFIMQSKGGAGKSVCSAILAQYLNEKTEGNLSLIDTDPSNKTLGSYQGLNVQMVDVIGSNKLVDQSKFDNFINDFIENAKSETEIKNNREIWHHYPEIFNEDSETGFVEIATEEIFRKFKIPYHDYKNDGKLPQNTRAIRLLESKIKESLSLILEKIPENENLIMYWEDNYRYNIEDNLFNIDDVNWDAIPVFIAETEKLAKENGIEKASLGSSIMINFNVRKQTLSFSATVKGERKDAYSTGDVQTGKVTNFRVK